jgi:hypothetical protein
MAGLDKQTSNCHRNNSGRARSQKGEMGKPHLAFLHKFSSGYSRGYTVPDALAGHVKSGARL